MYRFFLVALLLVSACISTTRVSADRRTDSVVAATILGAEDLASYADGPFRLDGDTLHVYGRINLRGQSRKTYRAGAVYKLAFHVDDDAMAPLVYMVDCEWVTLDGFRISLIEGKASCAILRARSRPTVSSRWNVLRNIMVDDRETSYSVATIVVMGAEFSEDVYGVYRNRGGPALRLASGNAGILLTSPFGDVAGYPSMGTPPVSQWLYRATLVGFIATHGADAVIVVGRGCGGWQFHTCDVSANDTKCAIQVGDPGGSSVFSGFYSGMIEGNTPISFRVLAPMVNCDLNGPTHTTKPYEMVYPDHADARSLASLESLIPAE